jgi:putative PIN family toxin of toxin-antitoxin system
MIVSPGNLPKVVFDTMILFQATAQTTGPAALLFAYLEAGRFTLYVSDEILEEARDVLNRPKLRARNPRITDEAVQKTFDLLSQFAYPVTDVPKVFSLPRDPDDEPYLDLALAANADYLVTWDKDMLDLMNEESFRSQYPGLAILNPVALLQALAASASDIG